MIEWPPEYTERYREARSNIKVVLDLDAVDYDESDVGFSLYHTVPKVLDKRRFLLRTQTKVNTQAVFSRILLRPTFWESRPDGSQGVIVVTYYDEVWAIVKKIASDIDEHFQSVSHPITIKFREDSQP